MANNISHRHHYLKDRVTAHLLPEALRVLHDAEKRSKGFDKPITKRRWRPKPKP
jgi:hypothetical protein